MTVSSAVSDLNRKGTFRHELRGLLGRRLTITLTATPDTPTAMKNLRQVFARDAFFRRSGKRRRYKPAVGKPIWIPAVGQRCDVILNGEMIGKLFRIRRFVEIDAWIAIRLRGSSKDVAASPNPGSELNSASETSVELGENLLRRLAAELPDVDASWTVDGRVGGRVGKRASQRRLHGILLPRLNAVLLKFSTSVATRLERSLKAGQGAFIADYDPLTIPPRRLPLAQPSALRVRTQPCAKAGKRALSLAANAGDQGDSRPLAVDRSSGTFRSSASPRNLIAFSQALSAPVADDQTTRLGLLDTGIADGEAEFSNRKIVCAKIQTSGDQSGTMKVCRPHETDRSGLHGTIVAKRACRLAPNAELVVAIGLPERRVDEIYLAPAVDWLVSQGVGVINLSLAITDVNGFPTQRYLCRSLARAVDGACDGGARIVAATGNAPAGQNGGGHVGVPATFNRVIAVAAYDEHGKFWERSGHGYPDEAFRPHFVAPGWHPSPRRPGQIETCTSYAAPIVSALILRALHEGLDPNAYLHAASEQVQIGTGAHAGKCRGVREDAIPGLR